MKKFKKYIAQAAAAAIALLVSISTAIPAYADNGTGELRLYVYYSDDITPQEGDSFTITYEDSDGNSDTLTIDASNYVDVYGIFEIPEDSYTVTDISYEGTNNEIYSQGYGIPNKFKIKDGDSYFLCIYIGEAKVSSLQSEYSYAVIKEGGYSDDDPVVYEDRNGRYIIEEVDGEQVIVYLDDIETEETESEETTGDAEEEEREAYEGNGTTETSGDASAGQSSSQEPVTEYYDTEDEDEGISSLAITALIIAIVGLGGGAAIFVAHKKGII